MKFIFEFLFLGFIFVIADVQANLIHDNKPIKHFWWGMVFAAIIIFGWLFESKDYWFLTALIFEHFVFFGPFLNFMRTPRMPFFYISSVGKSGSTWDKLFIKIESAYPYIWGAGFLSFFALQFKL